MDQLITPEKAGYSPEVLERPPSIDALDFDLPPNRSLGEALRSTRLGRAAAGLLCAAAVGGAAASSAEASPADREPLMAGQSAVVGSPETQILSTTIHIGKSKTSAESFSRAAVIANLRTVSKAEIREAQQEGRCKFFTAREAIEAGIYTQGYQGSGGSYAPENRPTTLCDTDENGEFDTRAECGNAAEIRAPAPEKAKSTIWVNNWNKAKLLVQAKATAKAKAECRTTDTYAYAEGFGRGKASAWTRIKQIVKAKGKIKGNGLNKIITNVEGAAAGSAYAKAKAAAEAKCQESVSQAQASPTPTPEQPPTVFNLPPFTDITAPQHMFVNGTAEVCERESDPDGPSDIVSRAFTKTRGNFISGIYAGDEAGEYCLMYRAPSTTGDTTLGSIVIDTHNNSDTDQATFPIVADNI